MSDATRHQQQSSPQSEQPASEQTAAQTQPKVYNYTTTPLAPDGFNRSAREDQLSRAITFQLKMLLRQVRCDNEKLLEWLEQKGVVVHCLEKGTTLAATAALTSLGYQPGFIPPSESNTFKFLVGTLGFMGQDVNRARQHGVMLLTPNLNKIGFTVHQVYHWMAYKAGLPGYSDKAQHLFRRYFDKDAMTTLPAALELPIEQLVQLRHAVRREINALLFVREVSSEMLAPVQNRYNMIMAGKTLA